MLRTGCGEDHQAALEMQFVSLQASLTALTSSVGSQHADQHHLQPGGVLAFLLIGVLSTQCTMQAVMQARRAPLRAASLAALHAARALSVRNAALYLSSASQGG